MNHVGIDRTHGLIRTWQTSAANAHDGARLPDLVSKNNTASGVWADTAYRSKKNEAFLAKGMFTSNIHQKKPRGQPMPERIARANAKRLAVRSAVEHVFAGRSIAWGCSSAPSAAPAPASRSRWPTWPITSSASPGSKRELRPHDAQIPPNGAARQQNQQKTPSQGAP